MGLTSTSIIAQESICQPVIRKLPKQKKKDFFFSFSYFFFKSKFITPVSICIENLIDIYRERTQETWVVYKHFKNYHLTGVYFVISTTGYGRGIRISSLEGRAPLKQSLRKQLR